MPFFECRECKFIVQRFLQCPTDALVNATGAPRSFIYNRHNHDLYAAVLGSRHATQAFQ